MGTTSTPNLNLIKPNPFEEEDAWGPILNTNWDKVDVLGSVSAKAIAAVTPAADRLPYFTSGTAAAVTALTSFARTILDDADAATARTTLGAAGLGANTFTQPQVFSRAADGQIITANGLVGQLQYSEFTGASYFWNSNASMLFGTSSAHYLGLGTNNTERMRITSAGDVGIGTTVPNAKLEIQGPSGSDLRMSSSSTLYLNQYVSASGVAFVGVQNVPMAFATNNTERMHIDASGNVGIGTSSPSFKLDVNGNSPSVATVARVYNGDASATAYAGLQTGTGSGLALQMYAYNGIGHVGTTSSNPLVFLSNNTERMRIDAAGAVTVNGTLSAATAAVDTNTTQVATTAYVVGQGYLKSATASSTYLTSATASSTYLTSATASSTYAPLASPGLTGTPTAPTAGGGTNTTQIATTAFVQSAVAGAGGVTLLGTLTTTSGTSQVLGSLVLTSYKFLRISWVGVSAGASNTTLRLNGSNIATENGLANNTSKGMLEYELSTGEVDISSGAAAPNNAPAITTATTTLTFTWSTGASFDAGTITVYGFK